MNEELPVIKKDNSYFIEDSNKQDAEVLPANDLKEELHHELNKLESSVKTPIVEPEI